MPALVFPTTEVHASFTAAMAEFAAEGRGGALDTSTVGADIRDAPWVDGPTFGGYVGRLRSDSLDDTPRPADRVPCTTLWWVENDEFIGRLAIRHRLTPWLAEVGGHIGYDVRPTRRREGHATAMLRAALPVAYDLGVHPALVTCDETNVASRKVIEAAGGEFEDRRGDKQRYWVGTRPGRHAGG